MALSWTAPNAASASNRRALFVALICGLITAFLVFRLVTTAQTGSGQPVKTIGVVVARQDIAARTVIDASMLAIKQVPTSVKLVTAYTDMKSAVGQIAREDIAAGEQVLNSQLVSNPAALGFSGRVPAGMRGISISAQEVTADGGLIQPGDHVDVVAIFQEFDPIPDNGSVLVRPTDDKPKRYVTSTLAQDVLVLAVAQSTDQPGAKQVSKGQSDLKTVTLAVSPDDAERIFLGDTAGALRLSLHRFDDNNQADLGDIHNNLPDELGAGADRE